MNYQGRSNKLEHSFSVIISWLRSRFCEKQLTSLSKLYVGKGTEELFVIFLRKSARYAWWSQECYVHCLLYLHQKSMRFGMEI